MIRINETTLAPRRAAVEAFVDDDGQLTWGVEIALAHEGPILGADRLVRTAPGALDGWCGLAGRSGEVTAPYLLLADRLLPVDKSRFALESTGAGLGIRWQGSAPGHRFEVAEPLSEIVLLAGTADSEARARSLFEPFLSTADFAYDPETRRLILRLP